MKIRSKFIIGTALILLTAAGFTHLWLPGSIDDCQSDITHRGHLLSLAPFHCIGHTERDYPADEWNHLHPWMDNTWEDVQSLE